MSSADLHRVVLASETAPNDLLQFRDGMTSKAAKLKHPGRLKEAGLIGIVTRKSTGYLWKKGPHYNDWKRYYEKKRLEQINDCSSHLPDTPSP